MADDRFLHIDEARCIGCDVCSEVAPGIRHHPTHVRATDETLDAMAECPTGAIVWHEDAAGDPRS